MMLLLLLRLRIRTQSITYRECFGRPTTTMTTSQATISGIVWGLLAHLMCRSEQQLIAHTRKYTKLQMVALHTRIEVLGSIIIGCWLPGGYGY